MPTDIHTWQPEDGGSGDPSWASTRYVLLERLGAGGMGEVWRAMDQELGRTVALKAIRPELATRQVARFLNEARATAQLEHRGIVPVHDVGRLPDGRLFYVMQEVRGETFASAIAAVHRASADAGWRPAPDGRTFLALVAIFEDVCDTLAYAHARGVLHRDLKPENVMLGAFGEVHVVDWGLVKRIGTSDPGDPAPDDAPRLSPGGTQVGQVAGTPGYMSPEQLAGRIDDLGRTSDVYSLGAILYHVLVGGPPSAWSAPVFDDPRLPPELVAICRRALDPVPTRRYPDAGALATAVRRWREEETARAVQSARIGAAEVEFLALGPTRRERVREVLLWLVDADGHAVHRRRDDLEVGAVDDALRAGVVVPRGEALHLADVGLLEWERLRAWIEADRGGQRLRHALGAAAGAWDTAGRRASDLWRGDRLAQAQAWRRAATPFLPAAERAFLDGSERAERRRRRWTVTTITAVGLGLAAAAIVATGAWRRSEQALAREQVARREAVARELSAEVARRELADQPHVAMVYEAARAAMAGEESALVGSLAARSGGLLVTPGAPTEDPSEDLEDPTEGITTVAGTITRRDPVTGATAWTTVTDLPGILWTRLFRPASILLASDHAGRLVALDATTGEERGAYAGLESLSLSSGVDPTGQFVVSSVLAGTVDLWEVDAGVRVGRIASDPAGPVSVWFAPEGHEVLLRSAQGTSRWTPPALRRRPLDACASSWAAPSPDGRRLYLQGLDEICVADFAEGARGETLSPGGRLWSRDGALVLPNELFPVGDDLHGLFSPAATSWRELDGDDGGALFMGPSGPLRVTRSGARVQLPRGNAVAQGGRWLLMARGEEVTAVDLGTGAPWLRLPGTIRPQLLAEVGVWGDRVVAGRDDGSLSVWALPATPAPDAPPGPPDASVPLAAAPVSLVIGRGEHLLVGHTDGAFEVLDPALHVVGAGRVWTDIVTGLALDAAGERLLVGGGHSNFSVWHLPTGRAITAVTRARRGLLHTVGWTADGRVWGAGSDGAWVWTVPTTPPAPLDLTNLRLCEATMKVVPTTGELPSGPWLPPGAPGCP